MVRREFAYNRGRERERERIADHGRYLDPNVIFERSPSDAPTAHLLQQALRESKSGHPEADHRFDEGKQLIESALERAPRKPRFPRIATTSLVECFRRWSEADLKAGLPPAALDHALRGLRLGIELHDSGSTDEQLMIDHAGACRRIEGGSTDGRARARGGKESG